MCCYVCFVRLCHWLLYKASVCVCFVCVREGLRGNVSIDTMITDHVSCVCRVQCECTVVV